MGIQEGSRVRSTECCVWVRNHWLLLLKPGPHCMLTPWKWNLKKKKYLLTITGAKLYFYCVKLLDFGVIYYRTNRILCNRCLHSDPNSAVYTLPKWLEAPRSGYKKIPRAEAENPGGRSSRVSGITASLLETWSFNHVFPSLFWSPSRSSGISVIKTPFSSFILRHSE